MPKEPLLNPEDKEFFEKLHKNYWRNHQELSSASQLSRDDKEFLLHLYDKLWENITNKENRLWNFLAFYGVGIGIVLGTATDGKLSFEVGFFLLVLTYWAAEITLSADWWSVRNRLMIRGIESRAYEAIKGVIPRKYRGPKYSSESLHLASLFVLAVLGLIIFAFSAGVFEAGQKIKDLPDIIKILITYFLLVLAFGRFANKREFLIKKYYDIFREFNKDFRELNIQYFSDKEIECRERKDKNSLTWRSQILFFYFILTLIVSVKYYELSSEDNVNVAIQRFFIFQFISLVVFIVQWVLYQKHLEAYGFDISTWEEKTWIFSFTNLLLIVFILISLVSPLWNSILEEILKLT